MLLLDDFLKQTAEENQKKIEEALVNAAVIVRLDIENIYTDICGASSVHHLIAEITEYLRKSLEVRTALDIEILPLVSPGTKHTTVHFYNKAKEIE